MIKAVDSDHHENAYQMDDFNHAPTHNNGSFMNVPESKKNKSRIAMTKPSLPMGIHSKQSSSDKRDKEFLHELDHHDQFQPPYQGFNDTIGNGLQNTYHPKPLNIADHLISDKPVFGERPSSPNMFNMPESTLSEASEPVPPVSISPRLSKKKKSH